MIKTTLFFEQGFVKLNSGGITMKNTITNGIKYIGAMIFLALVIGGPAIGGMLYMLNK